MPSMWVVLIGLWWASLSTHARGAEGPDPKPTPPTAVERALVELRCSAIPAARLAGTPESVECERTQLAAIRESFGRNLGGLSARDRRRVDAACGALLTAQTREAYVGCLDTELTAISERRRPQGQEAPAALAATDPAAVPLAGTDAAQVPPGPPADQAVAASPTGRRIGLAVGLVALVAFAGAARLRAGRARQGTAAAQTRCRTCGSDVADGGDLCPACRHEAVEALKSASEQRAAAERAEEQARQRAEEEQRHAAAEEAEQERQRLAQRDQDLREQAASTQRRRDEDARERAQFGLAPAVLAPGSATTATATVTAAARTAAEATAVAPADDVADPYAVLGLQPGASGADVAAAYLEAKERYDPQHAADFGIEVQNHFQSKLAAVERAYAALSKLSALVS